MKQLRLQKNLSVRDGDDVCRNVGGVELLGSRDTPASASPCAGITVDYINCCAQPVFFSFFRNYQTMLNTGCTISVSCTVFKGCDFSLTLPTLVNLHFLDYSPSSVYEGVCRGFSLDGHNDDTIIFLCACFPFACIIGKVCVCHCV